MAEGLCAISLLDKVTTERAMFSWIQDKLHSPGHDDGGKAERVCSYLMMICCPRALANWLAGRTNLN
jgi:hypothetical protein